jgi:ribose-phosphate pyrophosphokinase
MINAEIVIGSRPEAFQEIVIGHYPNNEPLVKISEPWAKPNRSKMVEPYNILLRPKTIGTFMAAMFYVDALRERGYEIPNLIFPFALGARQDRLNTSGDFLFTAKSIAKEINMRNFPSVTVVDCHSEVMPALIDRCRNVSLASLIKTPHFSINGKMYDGVISPDAGAEKRASAVAKELGLPLFHAWKKRDVTTGELSGFGVQELPNWSKSLNRSNIGRPRFIVVDDICDGGGTFVGLAKHITEYVVACDLDLLVTHGLFSQSFSELYKRFDAIYTTDSIIRDLCDMNQNVGGSFVKQIDICAPLLRGTL